MGMVHTHMPYASNTLAAALPPAALLHEDRNHTDDQTDKPKRNHERWNKKPRQGEEVFKMRWRGGRGRRRAGAGGGAASLQAVAAAAAAARACACARAVEGVSVGLGKVIVRFLFLVD